MLEAWRERRRLVKEAREHARLERKERRRAERRARIERFEGWLSRAFFRVAIAGFVVVAVLTGLRFLSAAHADGWWCGMEKYVSVPWCSETTGR